MITTRVLLFGLLGLLSCVIARHQDFREDGFVLSPADRQEADQAELDFDFPQFEDYNSPPLQRRERDGGFHSGGGRRSGRQGRRQNRRGQGQTRRQQEFPDQRQGRQTGGLGVALGVLNNPPTGDGAYNFNFANEDGSSRQEIGNPGSQAMLVSGSYSFISPEGELVEMQYTADENGYHASGSHMPTTPPPPPHVRRLLDHLAKVNGGVFY